MSTISSELNSNYVETSLCDMQISWSNYVFPMKNELSHALIYFMLCGLMF
jgi:hypothetical protein